MAYRSLFQPITKEQQEAYIKNGNIGILEAAGVPIQQPQQQAQQPQAVATQPQQPVQQQINPVQQAAQVPPDFVNKLRDTIISSCPNAAKNSQLVQIWNQFSQMPTITNLMNYITNFCQTVGTTQNQQTQQQPVQQAQPQQTTQPAVSAQPQQPVQQAQPQVQEAFSITPLDFAKRKVHYEYSLLENENDGSEDDDTDSKQTKQNQNQTSSNQQKTTTSTTKDDKNVKSGNVDPSKTSDKDAKFDAAYNKDNSNTPAGKTVIQNKDQAMHDSIFGTSNDDFNDKKDIKYDSAYNTPSMKATERDQHVKLTSPDPYNPEEPKLINMSNPETIGKTVFKMNSGNTVSDNSTNSTNSTNTKSSSDSSSNSETKDSSSANESFNTNYDSLLNESVIDDKLKDTIIREYINVSNGDFDISDFNEWLSDNYPALARDPKAFDEISSNVQNATSNPIEEYDVDDEIKNDSDIDDLADNLEDEDLDGSDDDFEDDEDDEFDVDDAVEDYMSQTSVTSYDEDDAIDWFDDNYEDASDEDLDDFLDAVSDEFTEDDINESIDDEFFANEPSIEEEPSLNEVFQ